ncbi:hypothetical protein Q8W71_06430 [Methylobacterium sp. NEAU 140]|uniref:hypothetical protein n=1 Tax=Methylobacterium sp. NEAU 140 TaxID=3064945 RepID=UPI0027349F09|nr:hypothetical protein [Methylobacterium sp. NEAU 140]MDP4022251.1 hypothetical protein [Methylobacterium sp. NEAU 140]
MSAALSPAAAIAYAARLLEARGFAEAARNTRGDSLYLRPPGSPWHLRLSNHPRTMKQRRRRTDVLTSLVIDAPRSTEQVETLVRGAQANFFAALRRRDGADLASDP